MWKISKLHYFPITELNFIKVSYFTDENKIFTFTHSKNAIFFEFLIGCHHGRLSLFKLRAAYSHSHFQDGAQLLDKI